MKTMKKFVYVFMAVVTALLVLNVAALQAQPLVNQWGSTSQGRNWPILNVASTPAGNANIAGPNPIPGNGWASIRGEFNTLEATTSQAVVVTGKIQFVGATGGGSTYTPLRYALTYHQNDTLNNALTSTASWVRGPGSGYVFCPRTGAGTVANGAWGSGTVGVVNNGNWNSTNSNGGPALATILQAPRNAQMIPGTYKWAISVQAVNDTTNEIRWYLIEQNTKYWFGGIVTGRAVTNKVNAINFGLNTGDWTQFNILAAQVDYGAPITVPEAPWQSYYVDQWGTSPQGRYWRIRNDASTLVGDATITGAAINGAGQATVRGGFGQDLQIKADEALIVSGELELVGTVGGESSYNPLRFALTYHATDTLRYALTDTARWVRGPGYGYNWCPRTGAGTVANGAWGSGTVGVVNNGNWNSTNSNGGPALATILQAPRNAQMIAGIYAWAISVQRINDTTNEIRWYLIEKDTKYWFGSIITGPAVTDKLNAINFGLNTGDWTEFNILAAQVDYGAPIVVPPAPFEAYYAENWGVIGNRFGGWRFTPGDVTGNATISGNASNTGFSAVRSGFLEPITPTKEQALIVTGQMEFVGGGFQAANSLRFGVFYSDSAGTVISTPVDSTRWSGTERAHSGYLFLPQSGSNGPVNWQANQTGTWGAVVNGPWLTPGGANNYALGSQLPVPANAIGGAGTYDFAISVAPQGDGTSEVRFKLVKTDNSYSFYGKAIDNHSPLATAKFNSVAFALGAGNTTTAMKLTDVYIDLGPPIDIPTSVKEGTKAGIPTEYVLDQNYPNPFNPTTAIDFGLPKRSDVKLVVFDLSGRVVTELAAGNFDVGYHSINFDAVHLASGVYYYKLKAGDFVSVKKLMLLK